MMLVDHEAQISIHAPARGATCTPHPPLYNCPISIHAPARGATTAGRCPDLNGVDFNPRSREGSDAAPQIAEYDDTTISIHAPTRGATVSGHLPKSCQQFQSTLPRGERHDQDYEYYHCITISIHAPTRGATMRDARNFDAF